MLDFQMASIPTADHVIHARVTELQMKASDYSSKAKSAKSADKIAAAEEEERVKRKEAEEKRLLMANTIKNLDQQIDQKTSDADNFAQKAQDKQYEVIEQSVVTPLSQIPPVPAPSIRVEEGGYEWKEVAARKLLADAVHELETSVSLQKLDKLFQSSLSTDLAEVLKKAVKQSLKGENGQAEEQDEEEEEQEEEQEEASVQGKRKTRSSGAAGSSKGTKRVRTQ
jgi:hypothetical protein